LEQNHATLQQGYAAIRLGAGKHLTWFRKFTVV